MNDHAVAAVGGVSFAVFGVTFCMPDPPRALVAVALAGFVLTIMSVVYFIAKARP